MILNFIHFKGYRQHSCFRQLYKTNYLIEWLAVSHGLLWQMYQLRKKNLPILLPSMVEAENFSDHPRTQHHFSTHQNSAPSAFLGIVSLRLSHSLSGSYIPSNWKKMMKTNSKISQFGLFVVNDASLMLYIKCVCFIQVLNLSHWSCCG